MDQDVVIRAQSLGKRYVIGHQAERESYVALRDVIARNARALGRSAMDLVRGRPNIAGDEVEDFWALRDVSFEIRRGEVVGVIGRNGAGKSTLLKILSRITEPTEGRVEIRGRVASLLEVGTGFHPELTGRENIYLNGAILGMTHAEIRRKFDEIVAFAEVERFLDTPVKRYSSGMYVRLAFAVAAHLEPEILIVDEVLAVGDRDFQAKCLGRMSDLAGEHGRTVIFVSHNLDAILRICRKVIVLQNGTPVFQGLPTDAVDNYIRRSGTQSNVINDFRDPRYAKTCELSSIWTEDLRGQRSDTFGRGEAFQICMAIKPRDTARRDFAIVVENRDSIALFATHLSDLADSVSKSACFVARAIVSNPALREGQYLISFASFSPGSQTYYDTLLHFPLFEVAGGAKGFPSDERWGSLYFPLEWQLSGP